MWGLAFTGFPYAILLRTGNPGAVNSSFILLSPFAFLTTSVLPKEALTRWLATIADFNPIAYVLAALRSLLSAGWVWADVWPGPPSVPAAARAIEWRAIITVDADRVATASS